MPKIQKIKSQNAKKPNVRDHYVKKSNAKGKIAFKSKRIRSKAKSRTVKMSTGQTFK